MNPPDAGVGRGLRVLRMDDVGASSKRFEVYSNWRFRRGPLLVDGNWLWLKYLPPFRQWGPYRELTSSHWRAVLRILEDAAARLTVGITAGWVNHDGSIVPFPVKYPEAASVIKEGVEQGLLEVANHGYTHCILKDHAFRPRWFAGNRQYHREFWPWVSPDVQEAHLRASQDILRGWLRDDVVTFVPPGNVFADTTLDLAYRHGLRYLSCSTVPRAGAALTLIDPAAVTAFHDRDLVLGGVDWLKGMIDPVHQFSLAKTFADYAAGR